MLTSLPDFCVGSNQQSSKFRSSASEYFGNWLLSFNIRVMAQVSNSRLRDTQAVSITLWSSSSFCTFRDSLCLVLVCQRIRECLTGEYVCLYILVKLLAWFAFERKFFSDESCKLPDVSLCLEISDKPIVRLKVSVVLLVARVTLVYCLFYWE